MNEGSYGEETSTTLIERAMEIRGMGTDSTNSSSITSKQIGKLASPLLAINSSSSLVHISSIPFIGTSSLQLSSTLIDAQNGNLSLIDISFVNISLSPSLFLHISPSTFLLNSSTSGCIFCNIRRSEGNGSMFEITLDEKKKNLTLNTATFTNCTSPVIYINVTTHPTFFERTHLSFISSTENIHILCRDVTDFIATPITQGFSSTSTHANFTGTLDSYSSENDALFTVESTLPSTHTPISASLNHLLFFRETESAVYVFNTLYTHTSEESKEEEVKASGIEITSCGWSDIPCLLWTTTIDHSNSESTLWISDGIHQSESESITFTSSFYITGTSTTIKKYTSLTQSDTSTGHFLLTSSSSSSKSSNADPSFTLRLQCITFTLPSSLTLPLFYVESGILDLILISFLPQAVEGSNVTFID